ncbi:uncharacterized protein LOC135109810 [Scylla paramamosain]|uniref:uncharacterized protein LOC135109810 n=1 Tax=Scylla paramamosain TaxID=85552 RepID=UPI0030829AAC
MLVPGVLWGAVALFLACSTTHATDEAQHAHQSTNDTQAQPKPEALIGQHWGPKPRQPARIPVIVSYRDPPLPHTLYTHALDRIQRVKSVSRGSLEDGRHLGDSGERGLAGLDPSPVRSVHSMTAEETWTLLGYPFSRPHASFGTRQHSTKGRGPPRHTAGPRQVQHQQTLRPLGPHPYPPMPPTRPHASRPRFPSRPLTPNPPPHPRVPINARPMLRPSTRPPPRPPPRPLPRPLPRPRPPLLDIKPIPTPRPPGTFTPDSLSVHDVAGPPYVNTAPTYILARSDVTNTTATTTTTLPSTTHKARPSGFHSVYMEEAMGI